MNPGLLVQMMVLIVAQASSAQIPGIRASEIVQTAGSLQPGSVWTQVVTNMSQSSIVTLHATFHCIEADGLRVIDENGSHDSLYQYSRDRDIPPGDTVTVRVSGHAQCSGGVDAAIFSDGHSEGDSEVIAKIYVIRKGLYKGLKYAIPLLDSIANGQSTTREVIAILDKREKFVSYDMTRSQEDREGESTAYGLVRISLISQADFGVPSDDTPRHQPRVEDLAKAMNIPREQALAIVLSNKHKEWLAALEGHTEAPEDK